MGKVWRTLFVASLVAGSIGAIAVPAAHALPAFCGGGTTIQNTRVNGDLEVTAPTTPGQSCTLSNVTVGNRLLVDPGANLIMFGTTVAGNLNATQPASIRIDALPSSCSGTACATPSIVRGTASIDGTTSVPPGFATNYICNGTKFTGDSLVLKNSAAAAPFLVGGTGCGFGGNNVSFVTRIQGNAGNMNFANNRSGDNINVNTNTGGGSFTNNRSGGSILCSGNVPAYTASGNSAAFADQSKLGTC
jgi:hypothetical protein